MKITVDGNTVFVDGQSAATLTPGTLRGRVILEKFHVTVGGIRVGVVFRPFGGENWKLEHGSKASYKTRETALAALLKRRDVDGNRHTFPFGGSEGCIAKESPGELPAASS